MTLFRVFSLPEARQRPTRTLLTFLSGVVGVAAVVSVALAVTSAHNAFRELHRTTGGNTAFEVVSSSGESFSADVVEDVRHVPGVAAASPSIERPLILYAHGKRVKAVALAVDAEHYRAVHTIGLQDGTLPADDELAVSADLADRLAARIGDEVKLLTRRGLIPLRLSGVLDRSNIDFARRGELVLLPFSGGKTILGKDGAVTRVAVVVESAAQPQTVRAAVLAALPPGLVVADPGTRSALAEQTLFSFEQALNLAGGLSLAVAFIVILNGFLMNVAERRKQLATLRSIGATRSQITRTVLLEAMALGLASGMMGVPIGLFGGQLVLSGMEAMLGAPLPPTQVPAWPLVGGVALGAITAVGAALLPAWHAARVSPLEALITVEKGVGQAASRRLLALGLGVFLVAGLGYLGTAWRVLPPASAIPTSVLVLLGFIVCFPAAMPLLSWAVTAAFAWAGPEPELARGYLVRLPVQTGLTVAVLFIGVSSSIAVGNSSLNSIGAVRDYIRHAIVGDFFLRAMMPDLSTGLASDLPTDMPGRVAAIPGVTAVDAARVFHGTIGEKTVVMVARDFPPDAPLPVTVYRGDTEQIPRRLAAGEVLLGTVLAHRLGKHVGDDVEITTPRGPHPFRIAGLITEYTVGGLALLLDMRVAREIFGIDGVDLLQIRAAPAQREQVEAHLRTIAQADGLLLQSHAALNAALEKMIGGVESSLLSLLAISVAATGVGIVNCLTMNILEQTHEYGVLRSLGMTQRQLWRMILWKAWIMCTVAIAVGVPVGLFMSFVMNFLELAVFGQPSQYSIWGRHVAAFVVLAYVVNLASALAPARRAVRIQPYEAIREE